MVANDGEAPVRLLYATSDLPGLTVTVPKEPVAAGRRGDVRLRASAPLRTGSSGTVRIHTSSKEQPGLEVRVEVAEAP